MQNRLLPRLIGAHRYRRAFLWVAVMALLAGSFAALAGLGAGLEESLHLARNAVLKHPGSGRILLVEIDARSLKSLNSWPWPRHLHGQAVTALDRAGASQIAFDVDFSSHSTPTQDAAFAAAIAQSRTPVILPTFRQAASQGSSAFTENLPLPALAKNALLGAVNISPDADGFIRQNPYGITTSQTARPSIAALLANASGRSNTSFPIDGSLDIASIPRISFVDLVQGRVPASTIAGRSVFIGATAVEMGDRYAVPGYGVIPGVLVQILAAETLIANPAPAHHGAGLAMLLVAAVVLVRMRWRRARHWSVLPGMGVAFALLPLATQSLGLGTYAVVPAFIPLLLIGLGDAAARTLKSLHNSRNTDAQTGLPNGHALAELPLPQGPSSVVVLRIANYADALAVLGQDRMGELMQRTAQRLSALTAQPLHRIEPNALAWLDLGPAGEEQSDRISAGIALFNHPMDVGGRPLRLVPAFGLAQCEDDLARAADRALMAADRAMAKGSRQERYCLDDEEKSDWRLTLASEVDAAMASGQIFVVYQPKQDIAKGQITAAEALVRWQHPVRGMIPPEDLISLVEDSGRIADLTLHILERALADQAAWTQAGTPLAVAVNVSALLPTAPGFLHRIKAIMAKFPHAAGQLTLEITESATLSEGEDTIAALEQLTALGITLSIDDYGTGQSTLTYLKRLPASEIKIDKSFVMALDTNRSDQLMVRSTIALAHELGYKVVAEGVESQAILDILVDAGCDVAQGWHIGRPMAPAALLEKVSTGQALAA